MSTTRYIQHNGEEEANELLCSLIGHEFRAYRERWNQVTNLGVRTDFPQFLVLEQHYRCNLSCVHCVHGYDSLKEEHGYASEMDDALFRKVIAEASEHQCPSLSMNSTNEPLMSRNVSSRIGHAAARGFIDIMLNTNGLLMTERIAEELIDSGLTRLMVSLDAFSEATYARIRLGSNFQKVMINVERFLDLRARRNVKLPLLRVSMVRLSLNEHEVDAFVEYWRDRADYIAIQDFASPAPGRAEFDLMFSPSHAGLSDFRCPQPWERLIVQGDGLVLPCCSQFARALAVGNAKTDSLQSIWLSSAMERLRDLHRRGRYQDDEVCRKCVSSWVCH